MRSVDNKSQLLTTGRGEHAGRQGSRAVATDGDRQRRPAVDAAPVELRRTGRDPQPGAGRHGVPVTFAGTVGVFHPGSAPVGVLMLSPFGYEEMCCRTTWRALAEAAAAAGLPCLRFDLPGTGDALDVAAPPGIDDWRHAAAEAAGLLRAAAGVDRLILLGQGLGAALAAEVAGDVGSVDAVAYLAPAVDGRRHLRELGLWARVITDRIGIGRDPDDASGCAVAGFALPPERAAAIRGLDLLRRGAAPALPSLVVARPERPADAALAAHLLARGAEVAERPYDGYDRLAADPSVAVPPAGTIAAVVAWLSSRAALPGPAPAGRPGALPSAPPLSGPGFKERPLRFGPGDRLFGVLCRPAAAPAGRAVVFVGSGRDPHVGLGRATVAQARALAARGIASLRFDPSGIGDSPPAAEDGREILYSEEQIDDVRAAIDVLAASGFGAVTLVGRCSGAHAAFHAALRDRRVERLAMVNLSRFVWDPREDVAESLRYGHRRLGDFGTVLWREGGWRRLLAGRLRVGAAGRHLARRSATAAALRLAPVLALSRSGRAWRDVRRGMAALAARRVPVALIYSADDPGLDELRRHFGPGGRDLAAYPEATLEIVADADHNFTHRASRDRLLAVLLRSVAA